MPRFFGYEDKENEIIIARYFSKYDLEQMPKCAIRIIQPFNASSMSQAKQFAKEKT